MVTLKLIVVFILFYLVSDETWTIILDFLQVQNPCFLVQYSITVPMWMEIW